MTGSLIAALAVACTGSPGTGSPGATSPGAVSPGATTSPGSVAGPVTSISTPCAATRAGDAEVELASDPAHGFVYAAWISCRKIGFARSADGGKTWGRAMDVPRPASAFVSWDPAITVGPSGTLYVAFIVRDRRASYPVVDISTDHGGTFRVSQLPMRQGSFGDRDFIAVGPHGEIYVTWDYAPDARAVRVRCFRGGSCAYTTGDLNAVLQKSTDGGKTWSKVIPVAPGFPASGSISAPILIAPSGRIDVLYERYALSPVTLRLGSGHDYFTSSGDGGLTWSAPVRLGQGSTALSPNAWWIDGSLGVDSAGNLYATWDTQSGGNDVGWLSYSVTGGRTWSAPVAVTPGSGEAVNIVQVLGGARGTAYIGLLTDSQGHYVQYLRAFSIAGGWGGAPIQVSRQAGIMSDWAGDTFGLALDGGGAGQRRVVVSWGSAVAGSGGRSVIWAAVVRALP